jgi:hypothetical protein
MCRQSLYVAYYSIAQPKEKSNSDNGRCATWETIEKTKFVACGSPASEVPAAGRKQPQPPCSAMQERFSPAQYSVHEEEDPTHRCLPMHDAGCHVFFAGKFLNYAGSDITYARLAYVRRRVHAALMIF